MSTSVGFPASQLSRNPVRKDGYMIHFDLTYGEFFVTRNQEEVGRMSAGDSMQLLNEIAARKEAK
jgi:hypothetical protein